MSIYVVNDCADTRFSNFSIKNLRENEKVRETIFVYSHGAQVESFMQKNYQKSRDTVSLKLSVCKQDMEF